jgi:hypothetical protein
MVGQKNINQETKEYWENKNNCCWKDYTYSYYNSLIEMKSNKFFVILLMISNLILQHIRHILSEIFPQFGR